MSHALFKTTIVVWTNYIPDERDLEVIASTPVGGDAYYVFRDPEKVDLPEIDPEGQGAVAYFRPQACERCDAALTDADREAYDTFCAACASDAHGACAACDKSLTEEERDLHGVYCHDDAPLKDRDDR